MATEAQIKANQANSQKSTGPRSPEGKARAAANSLNHGLCSAQPVVASHEQDDFQALRTRLLAEVSPDGALELAMFENLIHSAWDQIRIRRMQDAFMRNEPNLPADAEAMKMFEKLRRYYAAAERGFWRAWNELKTLQATRCTQILSEDETVAALPLLAATVLLTKRTQKPRPSAAPAPHSAPKTAPHPTPAAADSHTAAPLS